MNSDPLVDIRARLDRIDDNYDRLTGHIASIDITLAKQSVLLEEHIRRTNLLEDRLEGEIIKQAEALSPIQKHVAGVGFLIKFLGILSTAVGAAVGIYKLLGH